MPARTIHAPTVELVKSPEQDQLTHVTALLVIVEATARPSMPATTIHALMAVLARQSTLAATSACVQHSTQETTARSVSHLSLNVSLLA